MECFTHSLQLKLIKNVEGKSNTVVYYQILN